MADFASWLRKLRRKRGLCPQPLTGLAKEFFEVLRRGEGEAAGWDFYHLAGAATEADRLSGAQENRQ